MAPGRATPEMPDSSVFCSRALPGSVTAYVTSVKESVAGVKGSALDAAAARGDAGAPGAAAPSPSAATTSDGCDADAARPLAAALPAAAAARKASSVMRCEPGASRTRTYDTASDESTGPSRIAYAKHMAIPPHFQSRPLKKPNVER